MKYILSPVANEINGPISGLTFVNHQKSPYVRGNPVRPPAPSSSQSAVRSAYGALVSLWKSLEPWIKASWNAEAEASRISGFNFFVEANMSLELAGQPVYMCPPTLTPPAPESFLFNRTPKYDWFDFGFVKPDTPYPAFFYFYRHPTENVFVYYGADQWHQSTSKIIQQNWNNQIYEYWSLDRDNPVSEKGNWSDMSSVDPGLITQGVTSFGMPYNRYPDAGGYNTLPYSSAPGFFIQTDWLLSFWVYFEEPSSGDSNQYFLELDPALYVRRINFGSTIEFRLTGTSVALNVRTCPTPDNKWTHIAIQNDSTNNILYLWQDGKLDSANSYTNYADRASTRDYVIGGNPYRSSYNNIRLGNMAYSAVMSRAHIVEFEQLLRNTDVYGKSISSIGLPDDCTGHIAIGDLSYNNLSVDSFDQSRSVTP